MKQIQQQKLSRYSSRIIKLSKRLQQQQLIFFSFYHNYNLRSVRTATAKIRDDAEAAIATAAFTSSSSKSNLIHSIQLSEARVSWAGAAPKPHLREDQRVTCTLCKTRAAHCSAVMASPRIDKCDYSSWRQGYSPYMNFNASASSAFWYAKGRLLSSWFYLYFITS